MATFLYRLGRLAFRRRRLFVMFWIVVLAAVGIGAGTVSGRTTEGFTLPGTQSQKAIDLLHKEFPQASADGATARIVFEAPKGQTLASGTNRTEIESLVAGLRNAPQVANVADPYAARLVSRDGTIAYTQVTYEVKQTDITGAARDALHHVADQGEKAGLTVNMGGNAVQGKAGAGPAELIGVAVAAVTLLITFGSLLAAGLPLLMAVAGVLTAVCVLTMATAVFDMSSSSSTLALMLGLAVAIDYALFIVSRYRGELRQGRAPEEAAGRALGTAGSAVVFAGLTVIIALAGLTVIGIKSLGTIGLAAAFAVAVAVLIALTLLPAVLGFVGERIMRGRLKSPRLRALERGEGEAWGVRWAKFVTRNPVKVLAVAVTALVVLAIPALSLKLTLPDDSMAAPGSSERITYDTITKGFGDGYNGPLMIVVDGRGSDDPKAAAADAATLLGRLPDVASVGPAAFNQGGDVAVISAVPKSSPSSQATRDLVSDIRGRGAGLHEDTGADLMVTGLTAVNVDASAKMGAALIPYLGVVVGLALILLLLVFRSILVPLKAALGFLLSVVATLGVVVAVFQWGWLADVFGVDQTAPIVSFLPIFLVGVVFGLAMDYEVFLVTRMREEYVHGAGPTEAVIAGFRHSARVVTAAALIMISVFAGFLLDDVPLIKSMGMGLASAVLFDALAVRMTIVPAVMALVGRRAWALPGWLDRFLPNVDVEGEKLQHMLEAETETETETKAEDAQEPAAGQREPVSPTPARTD